jgi:hypothetical protein
MDMENIPNKELILKGEIIVIDDFLSSDEIEHFTTNVTFRTESDVYYPGRSSHFNLIINSFIQKKIEKCLDIKLNDTGVARLRVTNEADGVKLKRDVHIDTFNFNAVIYLTDPPLGSDGLVYGTRFFEFKHDKTRQVDRTNFGESEKWSMILELCSTKDEAWSEWKSIPFKKGRAVFFNGELFHAGPKKFFGLTDSDGRITLEYFSNLI